MASPVITTHSLMPQVLDDTAANIATMKVSTGWADSNPLGIFNSLAAWHGLVLVTYEGGPSYSGDPKPADILATAGAQRDSRFAAIFQK
jgi:hypothetical protein